MSRYFVQRRKSAVRASDDDWAPVGNAWNVPFAAGHQAVDTGLIDKDGNAILRLPNPIGFSREGEW